MPFVKGMKRPPGAGRKSGSPTKLSKEVTSRLNELGCDPVGILASLAMDEKVDDGVRRYAAAELMKYSYPRLSAIDHRLVDAEGKDRTLMGEFDRAVAAADAVDAQ